MANSVDGKVYPQEFQRDPLGGYPTAVVGTTLQVGNTTIKPGSPTTYGDRVPVTAKVPVTGVGVAAGDCGSWANPTGGVIIVLKCMVDVTTVSTGAATIDVGVAADAVTSSDTLIDGASTATTARVIDDVKDAGTNGTNAQRMTSSQVITVSEASGDVTGLVGSMYITYIVV